MNNNKIKLASTFKFLHKINTLFIDLIWYSIHCYCHCELLEPLRKVLNKYITYIQPFDGTILDQHARLCGLNIKNCSSGDGNLLFHLFNLIQHSLLLSLWIDRASEKGFEQIYHTHTALLDYVALNIKNHSSGDGDLLFHLFHLIQHS